MACWPVVPPFPENCTFLSPEDKALMLARIQADGGHVSDDEISFKKALHFLKDWKIWAGVAMNLGVTENANSLANFQPTILKGLGYTATQAQGELPLQKIYTIDTLTHSFHLYSPYNPCLSCRRCLLRHLRLHV